MCAATATTTTAASEVKRRTELWWRRRGLLRWRLLRVSLCVPDVCRLWKRVIWWRSIRRVWTLPEILARRRWPTIMGA